MVTNVGNPHYFKNATRSLRAPFIHTKYVAASKETDTHAYKHKHAHTHTNTRTHSSYMTLIGVHEMHGRVCHVTTMCACICVCHVTDLLVVDLCSSLL